MWPNDKMKNGFVADWSKLKFMLLNNKDKELPRKIRVSPSEIEETMNAKLLGKMMDNDQKWKKYFWRKKGL